MAVMTPRPAATLILLREGMEVLMLQRTQNAAFLGGTNTALAVAPVCFTASATVSKMGTLVP